MTNDQIFLFVPLLFSSAFSGLIAYLVWQRRSLPGNLPFTWIMGLSSGWAITILFQLNSSSFSSKLFWLRIEFSITLLIPIFAIIFAWQYIQNSVKWPWSVLTILAIHPIVNIYLFWFQPNTPLIWNSVEFVSPNTLLATEFGLWAWVSFIYICLIMTGAIYLFFYFLWQDPLFYRRQILSQLLSAIGPWTAVLLYAADVTTFNFAALFMPITGIILYWGFLRLEAADILPIARTHVVESLRDGIIVLDFQNRIIDINSAAMQLIEEQSSKPIGANLVDVLPQTFPLFQAFSTKNSDQNLLTFEMEGAARYFDCSMSLLADDSVGKNGRIFTLRDVTNRIAQEQKLHQYTRRLQFLHEMRQAMLHLQEPTEIAQTVLQFLKQMFAFRQASFVLFDFDKQLFKILAATEKNESKLISGENFPLEDYPSLSSLRKGEIHYKEVSHLSTFLKQHLTQSEIKHIANVPLLVQNELIGAINFGKVDMEQFTAEETAVLHEIATALAAAFQQAQLFEQERKQRELAQTLHDINQALNSSLDPQLVIPLILELLEGILPFDSASVMLRRGDCLENVSHRTIYPDKPRLKALKISDFPHIQDVFSTKQPQIIYDTNSDPRWQSPGITSSIKCWLGVPLIQNGEVIGLLNLSKNEPNFYDREGVETAVIFATQAVSAIENARLFDSEQQARKTAETLQAANIALTQSLELETILSTLQTYLSQLVPFDSMSIMMLDKVNQRVSIQMGMGYKQYAGMDLPQNIQFLVEEIDNVKEVFTTKKSLIIPDTKTVEGWIVTAYGVHIQNWFGVPLIAGGDVIGIFSFDKTIPNFFTQEHVMAAEALAAQAAVAIQNSRLFQETKSRKTELEALSDLSKALRLAPTTNEMLQTTLEMASIIVESEIGKIYLHHPASDGFVLRYTTPKQSTESPENNHSNSITAPDLTISMPPPSAKTKIIPVQLADGFQARQIQLPLQTQNHTVGLMVLTLTHIQNITSDKSRLLNAIADIAGSALHRAIILETLEQRVAERTSELKTANEQLMELDRLKSKFIADVSHELRTPITNLRLYLDLFGKASPQKKEHYIEVLQQQTVRLSSLVEDILSLSSIEAETSLKSFEKLDLNQIIQKLVLHLSPLIQQGNNQITLNLHDNLPPIHAINKHIERAISNLLVNAGHHTENGEIKLCTNSDQDWVYLQIQDTGSGIPAEDLPHIFERFYRGNLTGQSTKPGTGLGLAIVKEIALIHNGDIEVESKVNQGTQFTLRLPLKKF